MCMATGNKSEEGELKGERWSKEEEEGDGECGAGCGGMEGIRGERERCIKWNL